MKPVIGVFDSGVGGLTVVRELMRALPGYKLVYLGDTARVPYGTKSRETIVRFAREDIEFLVARGAAVVVAACGTVSSQAIDELRPASPVPLFEVVSGGVAEAVRVTRSGRIGVMATTGTIRSGVHEAQIRAALPSAHVTGVACPLLVSLVEEGWHRRPETRRILRRYLRELKRAQVDTVVLACTHFPLLREAVAHDMGARVRIVDPAVQVAEQLKKYLAEHVQLDSELARGESEFYATDVPNNFDRFAKILFGHAIRVEKVDIG